MANILSSSARQATISLASDVSTTPASVLPAARTAGPVYRIFPTQGYGHSQERFITNPNAAGSIWVTFFDGVIPAASGEGSFEIAPGQSWSGSVNNEVRCIFTAAAMTILAGER